MEEPRFTYPPTVDTLAFPEPALDDATTAASQPYVGRWNHLVSTTNWEKGAIIAQWRDSLQNAELPSPQYSDEAWARLVGGVTGQHVGRLRRVYQRFGGVFGQYDGLFWSHFQAALDWDDAEMWLEGAVQNNWSVSAMRRTRWETMGAIPELRPQESEVVATEPEEDFVATREPSTNAIPFDESTAGPRTEGPDFGDEDAPLGTAPAAEHAVSPEFISTPATPVIRPFEHLAELPEDVAEAFEQFKLAILRHRAAHWNEISRDDLLSSLEALKVLAMLPPEQEQNPLA